MLDRLARAVSPVLLVSALLDGCYLTPYDGQVVGEDALFGVSGYTDIPNAQLSIEVLDKSTGQWTVIGTATSEAAPAYPAGWFSTNSPNLYGWNTQVRVADPAAPWTYNRWGGTYSTRLRVRNLTAGTALYGGDEISLGCFFNTNTSTSDFYSVAWECGWDTTEITIVRAIL